MPNHESKVIKEHLLGKRVLVLATVKTGQKGVVTKTNTMGIIVTLDSGRVVQLFEDEFAVIDPCV